MIRSDKIGDHPTSNSKQKSRTDYVRFIWMVHRDVWTDHRQKVTGYVHFKLENIDSEEATARRE
jgi:hypothetical protein